MILVKDLIFSYFSWHYCDVSKEILKAIKNFLKFGLHFFSIPFLIKTLFSYWHKYFWTYPKYFDPWVYFVTFLSNLISRMVGASVRLLVIFFGIFFEVLVLVFGIVCLFCWVFLPLILFFGFWYGIKFLFGI